MYNRPKYELGREDSRNIIHTEKYANNWAVGELFREILPLFKGHEEFANMDCFLLLIYRPV